MKNVHFSSLCVVTSFALVACTTTNQEIQSNVFEPKTSYLKTNDKVVTVENAELVDGKKNNNYNSKVVGLIMLKDLKHQNKKRRLLTM